MNVFFHEGPDRDLLDALPALRGLHAPGGETWAVLPGGLAGLAEALLPGLRTTDAGHPALRRLHWPPGTPREDPLAAHDLDVARFLGRAERVLSFVSRGDDDWAASVRAAAPDARIAFVPPRPAEDEPWHVADHHLRRIDAQDPGLAAALRDAGGPPTASPGPGPVALCPGSPHALTAWPDARWHALADRLAAEGIAARVLLDRDALARLSEAGQRAWRARGALVARGYGALAAALDDAALVLGTDGLALRLAGQLGRPTLALCGPTRAERWAPRGAGHSALQAEGPSAWARLDPEEVAGRLHARLAGA